MSILFSFLSPIRAICMAFDKIAFGLLDDVYNVVINLASAELLEHSTIKKLMFNLYILFGVVAFFKLAMVLVNSIIDPEKLNEKGKGLSNIFFRVVGMIIILGITPFLFEKSYDLQNSLVNKEKNRNIIFDAILGNNASIGGENAGVALKNIALSSLITIDEYYLANGGAVCAMDKDGKFTLEGKPVSNVNSECGFVPFSCTSSGDCYGGYIYGKECDWKNCRNAVQKYNQMYMAEKMDPSILAAYVGVSSKNETTDEEVYVYDYMFIITSGVGIFMTYIILMFGIDIAVRMFELIVLEILSPLFIATFVDPKSAQSGPFKNWLSAVGKSYVSLYIRLATLALMILLVSFINQSDIFDAMGNVSGWGKLFTVIGLLIFAKKAPKWIGDMIGIKGEGLGGLNLAKKLGGMALAGGLASKALTSAGKFAAQKGKNFLGNRARNTAARLGAMHEQRIANKAAKKNGTQKGMSMWQAGRTAAKQSRTDNWGKNIEGWKDIGTGLMAGRMAINPEAKDLKTKLKEKADKNALKYNEKIGNTEAARALKLERANNNKEARKLYNDVKMDSKTGDRLKIRNAAGEDVYVNPRGAKEMNQAFGKPVSEYQAYQAYGTNLAHANGLTIDGAGKVVDSSGKVIASSAQEYALENMSYAGQLAIKSLVADNVKDNVARYTDSKQQVVQSSQDYSQAVIQYNQIVDRDPNAKEAISMISQYENLMNNPEFAELRSKDRSTLTEAEQEKLTGYLLKMDDTKGVYEKAKEYCKESGLEKIIDNLKESRKRVEDWSAEVSKLEKQMSDAMAPAFDEQGKIKRDSSGNIKMENPYNVVVDGETLSPVTNFVRINEINNALSIKSSKAKSKYDDAVKESDGK